MIQLSDPVPQGTRLTYAATIAPSLLRSIELSPADSTVAATSASLASKWGLQVEQSGWTAGLFSSNFDVTLKILVNSGYGRLQDVLDVISGEFYNAAGATVQSARITDVTAPGAPAAAAQSTGAPGATAPAQQNAPSPSTGLSSEVLILIGVLIVVAIVVLAIVFSPSTPARVAASFAGAGG